MFQLDLQVHALDEYSIGTGCFTKQIENINKN